MSIGTREREVQAVSSFMRYILVDDMNNKQTMMTHKLVVT